MKLNVNERLTLTGVIPQKGNFETMATVDKLKKVLYLSEEETIKYDVKQGEKMITWNKEASERKEIEIGELALSLIMKSLKKLDDGEELTEQQYNVYKAIKEEEEEKKKVKDKKQEEKQS